MKILQLVTMRQRRGAEVFATQLSDALWARGHEVTVLGLYPAEEAVLDPQHAAAADLATTRNGKLNLRVVGALHSYIRRERPDVVQSNGSETLKYGTGAKRLSGLRLPLVYRNISIASQWLRSPAHQAWGRWLVRAVDHVSSVSQESSTDFGRTYGVPAERLSVIRRGILLPDVVRAAPARRRLLDLTDAPHDARLLVHVGRYSEEKNHGWLVDTFVRIRDRRADAHLVLIGDGPLRPAVEAQVRALGLERCVHLLGLRPDAAELVAGADVFVLPSRIEGIPGVVLEAGAQAVPAVATNVGGMPEAIVDAHTGVLVAPGEAAAFADAVLGLLHDEARRARMGAAARELVKQRFSMDATAAAFEHLYLRLIRDQRR